MDDGSLVKETMMKRIGALSLFAISVSAAITLSCVNNPRLNVRELEKPEMINGVLCSGRVVLNPEGKPSACTLAEEMRVIGGTVPAGSSVRFLRASPQPLFVLQRSTTFGSVTCRGFMEFYTRFHPNGQLESCALKGNQTIDGVPCAKGTVAAYREQRPYRIGPEAVFHETGKLRQCIASRRFTRDGTSWERGDIVRLSANGAAMAVRGPLE